MGDFAMNRSRVTRAAGYSSDPDTEPSHATLDAGDLRRMAELLDEAERVLAVARWRLPRIDSERLEYWLPEMHAEVDGLVAWWAAQVH